MFSAKFAENLPSPVGDGKYPSLASDIGTMKTIESIFWPWHAGECPDIHQGKSLLQPLRFYLSGESPERLMSTHRLLPRAWKQAVMFSAKFEAGDGRFAPLSSESGTHETAKSISWPLFSDLH